MDFLDIENLDFSAFCSSQYCVVSNKPYIVKNDYGLALVGATDLSLSKEFFDGVNTVCVHDEQTAKNLTLFGFERGVTCYQFAYLSKNPPKIAKNIEIKRLDETYLPFVENGYGGGEYAKRLLSNGKIYGGFNGEVPIGFIGTHDANTIGLIFVSPEHRKKGYAKQLLSFMIEKQLSTGLTPLTQVVTGNYPSIALHESLGFTKLKTKTIWLKK